MRAASRLAALLVLLAVAAMAGTACGGGAGEGAESEETASSSGSITLTDAFVRSADGVSVDEIDVSTQDRAEVVLTFGADGEVGSVTPDLRADVLLDGQDTTGELDRFTFAVGEQSVEGFTVTLVLEPLVGASDLLRLAEGVESAGIDPADAGMQLIEDRGDDGVLELDVRIRGTVRTTEQGDAPVDESVTVKLVESDGTADEGETAADATDEAVAGAATGTIEDGVVTLVGPGGASATAPVPAGWDTDRPRPGDVGVELDLPSGIGFVTAVIEPLDGRELATFAEERALGLEQPGWADVEVEETEVAGRPARIAVSNDGTSYGMLAFVDLGSDVLVASVFGSAADLETERADAEAFLQSFELTPA